MSLPAPTHIAQLTAGGRFPNGQLSGRYDCTPASAIMALDAYSHGAIRPTITEFRAKQRDNDTNGMGLNDAATAWRAYGQTLIHGPLTWGQVMTRLRHGDGVILQGQSGALGPYLIGRSVAHAIYVQRAITGRGATYLVVDDPLANAARSIPERYVRAFYLSGLALAGYGKGTYAGPSSGAYSGHPYLGPDAPRTAERGADGTCPAGYVPMAGARYCVRADDPTMIRLDPGAALATGLEAFGAGLGDTLGKVALLGGIVVLGLMGAYLALRGGAPPAIITRAAA